MASDARSLWIPANTGNPVDVFFPDKDMAIAVYERGYTSISLAKGGGSAAGWRRICCGTN